MKYNSFYCLNMFLILNCNLVFSNWITGIGQYLGYYQQENKNSDKIYEQIIPYEVSITDENFIKEAAKLTDLTLSDLDTCQHRVILKLKSDCDKLNDEQLAKMAVHLLNCQSWVEGRSIYPCTDEMSIKDCTISMDSDTWTSYHLISNRARAVCYTVRQSQFRGLAEHTINRLMDASRNQLNNLGQISNTQQELKVLAKKTYSTLSDGHNSLFKQQDDLKKAQFTGQLAIENNIRRLADEKKLIKETHNNLIIMTRDVQQKLEISLSQLQDQSDESKINHEKLINDLLLIQEKTRDIFERIEQSSLLLIQQNDDFNRQYKSTFESIQDINKTVSDLVVMIKSTWLSLEERLIWIVAALGGTDIAIDRIYIIVWHSAFMLLSMLTCAFLAARNSTRLVVAMLPPLNLATALYGQSQHLDFLSLSGAIGAFVIVQTIILWASSMRPAIMGAISWKKEVIVKESSSATKTTFDYVPSKNTNAGTLGSLYSENDENYDDINTDTIEYTMTPPASRNGDYVTKSVSRSRSRTPLLLNTSLRSQCTGTTRAGTACKLTSLPGRDFCYRHIGGSSIAS